MSEPSEPSRIRVNDVTWIFESRDEPLRDPMDLEDRNRPITLLPGVIYQKIPFDETDNGIAALLASVNAVRAAAGDVPLTADEILDAAEQEEVESDQENLREEHLVRIVERLGAYRLAIIEPNRSRTRLGFGSQSEGTNVYVVFDGVDHWDGVQLRASGQSVHPGAYPQYTRVHSSPDPAPEGSSIQDSPQARAARKERRLKKLKDEIRLEMHEADRRNLAAGATFRIRTWAGHLAQPGQPTMGEGLRAVSRQSRPGKRTKRVFAGLKRTR
ncbi:hypothetical protein GP486_002308 [Trichoglossum hirsutum]|uniref:Uncharacterized protein n=1 Tax=Trichoglossum hirsutum TaxID=265104 RepID=A0A9P8LF89_9PEZI|nr:hypothetical protein GP486_002308 [Trichoglossum hirsutum]